MMTSRERVELALAHQEPDRVPLDLGGTDLTGMHVSSVYRLRQTLGLDPPGTRVKVVEPYLMLGEVKADLADALGADAVKVTHPINAFGFTSKDWKPWATFDGTPVLVPDAFNTEPAPNGDILMYPEGDTSVPPSARMPKDGFYFDAVSRQQPIDDERLEVEDNLEEFGPISDEALHHIRCEVEQLTASGKAIVGDFGGTSFGDVAAVPGMGLKHPKGIRDVEEWYVSLSLRADYISEVFERQCEIGLQNLTRIHDAIGDRITAVIVTGADFGAQHTPLISPRTYRQLFKPVHACVNEWIHTHTQWKSFIHSCGSIWRLLDDIVDAGFDILNPVQTSAAEMGPTALKARYGNRITFWGGGIDTQGVLPFATPAEVREMVRERMAIFGRGGGFVFGTEHNVQAGIPVENLLALYDAVASYRDYSML